MSEIMKDVSNMRAFDEACNEETSPERLSQLVSHETFAVRFEALQNVNTPVEVVSACHSDEHSTIRVLVAKTEGISLEAVKALSESHDVVVRVQICKNATTPASVLAKLLNDADPHVWWAAMCNPNVDLEEVRQVIIGFDGFKWIDIKVGIATPLRLLVLLLSLAPNVSCKDIIVDTLSRYKARHLKAQAYEIWGEKVSGLPADWVRKLILAGNLTWDGESNAETV